MIIAMVNNKGGVGKTACTVNLAHALHNRGKKVLVIDNDPQANSSALLLGDITPEHTLFDVYMEGLPAEKAIYPTLSGVHLLPNTADTAMIETDLYTDISKSYAALRNATRDLAIRNYDICLIDCPPTLGLWMVQAMLAADAVIVPVEAGSRFSLDGLTAIYATVEQISAKVNPDLKFLKALINKVDMRTSASRAMVELMRTTYPGKTFETTIPTNTPVQQAEIARTTVLKYDPLCNASKKFRLLADELIEVISHA